MGIFTKTKWATVQPVTPPTHSVPENFKIPLIIHQKHQYYKLPERLANNIKNWSKVNPEFEHRYYDDKAMWDYVRIHGSAEFNRAFDHLAEKYPTRGGALLADLFRLLLLSRDGGIWADADSLATGPITQILKPNDQYITRVNEQKQLSPYNLFMASVPRHPFIILTIKNAIKAILSDNPVKPPVADIKMGYAGPYMLLHTIETVISDEQRTNISPGVYMIESYPEFSYRVFLRTEQRKVVVAKYGHDDYLKDLHAMKLSHWILGDYSNFGKLKWRMIQWIKNYPFLVPSFIVLQKIYRIIKGKNL